MIEKDKDLFLDILENPYMTVEDLVSVGHSEKSTRFLDKSIYENSQRVRDKFTDADGNFKQNEFDAWYDTAARAYQAITNKDTNLSLLNITAFNESDITVDPSKRTLKTDPIVSFSPNPDRTSTSIYRVGKTSEREHSMSELAQAEKVLLNPVEAAKDPSKAKWGDSPNDSWWGNFFDTQVLAQWDEDGEHIDPVTKLRTTHKKGDFKLNENGTYYYEALDGRDVYGKQVLNKLNTITTDGSFWNQYDFLDSDDIREKSFVGSVAKNLALVGSMFIPYVGWGIAGASVAVQTAGLIGTLGKMLSGSDSPTFSAMEGWAKSLNRQSAKSEYAQQNMLCWENFINLIGDVTALLREQRAIFKFAPAIFGKGKYGIQSEHMGANATTLQAEKAAALRNTTNPNLSLGKMARAVGTEDPKAALLEANKARENIISRYVENEVENYFKSYNKLGEQLGRAYMVGITVGDTYGEAKEAGATDFEAALLTMGYAAAENALLKSDLGRWIFPELKAEQAELNQIAKVVTAAPEKVGGAALEGSLKQSGVAASKAELIGLRIAALPQDAKNKSSILGKLDLNSKLAWMKKWFNAGRDIFNQEKSLMRSTAGAMVANALAEGTEEVSEELLKDFSTSCFNLVKAAQGDKETRMQGFLGTWDWNEALKRYGMSFFGGLVGGGINSAAYDYRQFKDIANMSSETAIQKLVWMDRNNELDKFWDVVSKSTLGDRQHSTKINENGVFELGTPNNNQDLEVKKALRQLLDLIHNILTANGANLDDEGLIGQVMQSIPDAYKNKDILGDFRTQALTTSVTAGRFLKEYNSLCKAIVLESIKLKELNDQVPDTGNTPEDLLSAINESKNSLQVLQQAKDDLLQGKRTLEFYRDALFETTYGVSELFIAPTEVQFMELCTGKPYSLITKEERDKFKQRYVDWSKSERAEQVHQLADIFYTVALNTSQALQESTDFYNKLKTDLLKNVKNLQDLSLAKLDLILSHLKFNSENPLESILEIILNMAMDEGNLANPMGLTIDLYGDAENKEGSLSEGQLLLMTDDYLSKINAIRNDASLTNELKVPKLLDAFASDLTNKLSEAADEILQVGYIHPEVKRNFVPVLNQTINYCKNLSGVTFEKSDMLDDEGDQDGANFWADLSRKFLSIQNNLQDKVNLIELLNYTPISQNLKNFGLALGTEDSVLSLVDYAIKKEQDYQSAIDNIVLDEEQGKLFDEAEKLLKLYRASIVAARVDNADFANIYGYNKTLNDLCGTSDGYVKLAEIDAETANLAIEDVNMALKRLDLIKGISELNQGNKLNVQNYASANKSYIFYGRMKNLTSMLNEDDPEFKDKWNQNNAFDNLKAAIDSMTTHAGLFDQRKLSLSTEEKVKIEEEQHRMDDAIYDFFKANKDKLKNSSELADFIKHLNLDFYNKNEDLLTHNSKDIDDGAFIWWLASKAALRSSDFYKVYKDYITDDVAPISTQELGIYAAIASIYNGTVFVLFGQALRQYIKDDWESKGDIVLNDKGLIDESKSGEKLAILKNRGLIQEGLPLNNAELNKINHSNLVPQFNNILFIEGIAGSGKSNAVFRTLLRLLSEVNPEIAPGVKLLSKPIIVAHTDKNNADDLVKSMNLKDGLNIITHGKKSLMEYMSAEFKDRLNPETGRYEYYDEDLIMADNGEIHSKWAVRQLDPKDVPQIIFIDEWSRYTQPEIDLIHRFASQYQIQIIAAGDLDQLMPSGYWMKEKDGLFTEAFSLTNSRNITPRVPKLGISMRSGNGLKVINIQSAIAWKRNKTTDPLNMLYVETDKEIYGDKIHNVGELLTDAEVEKVKADIDKLVADLKDGEKIGYIYHDKNSKLYQLLTSNSYKTKIEPLSESSAQGREARYYIVENNRKSNQSDDDYFRSFYTGISRASQAAIVLAPNYAIGQLTVKNPANRENKLIPDNFTVDGIKRFASQRKNVLTRIYGNELGNTLNTIIPRERVEVEIPLTLPLNNNSNTNRNNGSGNGNNQLDPNNPPLPPAPPTPPPTSPTPPSSNPPSSLNLPGQQGLNPPPPTAPVDNTLTVTPEAIDKVVQVISNVGLPDPNYNGIVFKSKDVAQALGLQSDDLSLVLQELDNNNVILSIAGNDNYLFYPDKYDVYTGKVPPTTLPESEDTYLVNDVILTNNGMRYEIIDKEEINGETWYTLKGPRSKSLKATKEFIDRLIKEGDLIIQEDTHDPQDGSDRPPTDFNSSDDSKGFLKGSEEDAEQADKDVVEVDLKDNGDILVNLIGYTHNVNYLGVKFENGKPIIPKQGEPGSGRIVQANGLIKLNPEKFNTEEACRNVLGTIKKALLYKSNEGIIRTIKDVIDDDDFREEELQLKWVFLSKAKERNSGFDSRFWYNEEDSLDYMSKLEHETVPIKTLSVLVGSKSRGCVLELPVLTLASPFTILYKLGELDPGNEIFKVYAQNTEIKGLTHQKVMQEVINAIKTSNTTKDSNGKILPGYLKLAALCKLWQYTSDGIREVGKIEKGRDKPAFNLSEATKNLGIHYIKNRHTELTIGERKNPYDYLMLWNDLTKETNRPDRNYSSIMIMPNTFDGTVELTKVRSPFVLRSDSDAYVTDEDMMQQFIFQRHNPNSLEIVKLIPVCPPEMDIATYLKERTKLKDCIYGNEFTAYRILNVIRGDKNNPGDPSLYNLITNNILKVNEILNNLNSIAETRATKQEINKLQKEYLRNNDGIHILSNALFQITHDYKGESDNLAKPIDERIAKIADIWANAGKTGILHRPSCVKAEESERIAGVAVLVQTGSDKYTAPDGHTYRIYSKYDSPSYDLNAIWNQIENWAASSYEDNNHVWHFNNPHSVYRFYTSTGELVITPEESKNQLLRRKHALLLEKTGLKDYDKLNGIDDELKFLIAIRDKFTQTPGNIAVLVDNENLICTTLNDLGVTSTDTFKSVFGDSIRNATQISCDSNNNGDCSYTLSLSMDNDIKSFNITLKGNEIEFDTGISRTNTLPTEIPEGFDLTAYKDKLIADTNNISDLQVKEKTISEIEKYTKIIDDTLKAGGSIAAALQAVLVELDKLRGMQRGRIKNLLSEFFNLKDSTLNITNETENKACSIKINKKFK